MKKQKLYPFTVGTGMSIENSTPEERKEIADLIAKENPENYGTYLSKYCNEMHLREIKFCNGNFDFPRKSVSKVTNPLTYSQMKALITGERTKLTHAQAVEKLKGGAQLYVKNRTDFSQIKKLFPFVYKDRTGCYSIENGYVIAHGELYVKENPIQGVEIIELGDIDEETDNKVKSLVSEEMFNNLDKMIKKLKKASKLSKQLAQDSKRLFSNQTMRMDEEMKLSVDFAKTEVKQLEKVEPVELEKGKWYKNNNYLFFIENYTVPKTDSCEGNTVQSYGFCNNGDWDSSSKRSYSLFKNGRLATPEEVETALTNYAKSIGLVEGAFVLPFNKENKFLGIQRLKSDEYKIIDNTLCVRNSRGQERYPIYDILFKDGVWRKVAKTRIRKEVEEELNIKIVD